MLSLFVQAQDQFVPFTGTGQENLPATPLIYAAYAIAWLVIVVYVLSLWTRIGKVERDLKDVAARIKPAR